MASDNGRHRTETTWKDQFLSSIRHWLAVGEIDKYRGRPLFLMSPLDQIVEKAVEEVGGFDPEWDLDHSAERLAKLLRESNQKEVLSTAFHAILHLKAPTVLYDVIWALKKCETPIEVPMLLAITIVGKALFGTLHYVVEDIEIGDSSGSGPRLSLEPQAQLGEHRVDFLLTAKYPYYLSHLRKLPDGREVREPKEIQKERKIIIECDGHDFHDRTREQARKDRSRDRALQSLGYRVFRYTGSEIWSNVFMCAHEAVTTLCNDVSKEYKEGSQEYKR